MRKRNRLITFILLLSISLFSGCKFHWFKSFKGIMEDETCIKINFYIEENDVGDDYASYFTLTYLIGSVVKASDLPKTGDRLVSALHSGYELKGWKFHSDSDGLTYCPDNITVDGTSGYIQEIEVGYDSYNFYGEWDYASTTYTVKHLFESLEDETEYICDESLNEKKSGITYDNTEAESREIPGFEPLPFAQVRIEGDGSTVVEIKYKRKELSITIKAVTDTENIETITAKYGKPLSYTPPEYNGWTITGWKYKNLETNEEGEISALPETIPAYSFEYEAIWKAQSVNYKVHYYKEKLEDDATEPYEFDKTVTFTGLTGTKINPDVTPPEGFELDGDIPETLIAGDGSTELVVKYKRKRLNVSFDTIYGEYHVMEFEVKYGQQLTKDYVSAPVYAGYIFKGWTLTKDSGVLLTYPYTIESNVTFYAVWQQVSEVTVEVIYPEYAEDNEVITINKEVTNGILSLSASGYKTYKWYIDGELKSSSSTYNISLTEYIGRYEVLLVVSDINGNVYSQNVSVIISKGELKNE